MRKLLVIATLAAVPTAAAAEQAYTTRIEPRPYYGATVTIEEGVRVFRPLPPHNRIIINPGNKANVNLTFDERGDRGGNVNNNFNAANAVSGSAGSGGFGGGYGKGGPAFAPNAVGPGYQGGAGAVGPGFQGGSIGRAPRAPVGGLR